jgi:hypothetical protein
MSILETFLDKYNSKTISTRIYDKYELFGYELQEEFILDINFIAKHIYN